MRTLSPRAQLWMFVVAAICGAVATVDSLRDALVLGERTRSNEFGLVTNILVLAVSVVLAVRSSRVEQ